MAVDTDRLGLARPDIGDDPGLWGDRINAGFDNAEARFMRLSAAGTPVGSLTPHFLGQLYFQSGGTPGVDNILWVAVGLTINDWVPMGPVIYNRGELVVGDAGGDPAALPPENEGDVLTLIDIGGNSVPAWRPFSSLTLPRGYIDGYEMSGDGVTTLTVNPGEATSIDKTRNLVRSAAIGKAVNSAFVKGDTFGALGQGVSWSNSGGSGGTGWYHAYSIYETAGPNDIDIYLDSSPVAANIPAGWEAPRRIGAIFADGSDEILPFDQSGDNFLLSAPIEEFTDMNPGTLGQTKTFSGVPHGIETLGRISINLVGASGADSHVYVSSMSQTDVPTTGVISQLVVDGSETNFGSTGELYIKMNAIQQLRYRLFASAAGTQVSGASYGWVDSRGKNA